MDIQHGSSYVKKVNILYEQIKNIIFQSEPDHDYLEVSHTCFKSNIFQKPSFCI